MNTNNGTITALKQSLVSLATAAEYSRKQPVVYKEIAEIAKSLSALLYALQHVDDETPETQSTH